VVDVFAELAEQAAAAGLLRAGRPRRLAAIVVQTATYTAQRLGTGAHAITADEVWDFCRHALVPDAS